MEFRTLRANEIDARIGTLNEKGCTLLLYKDARVDMTILDETVGAENWQRRHELINGNLFCNVSINTPNGWVTKQDVGVESYTEKEKGQASDAFKRACVNWGIGRELYTSPFIWIPATYFKIENKNGKLTTYTRFYVKKIEYTDGLISELQIVNGDTHKVVFTYGASKKSRTNKNAFLEKKALVLGYINRHGIDVPKLCKAFKIKTLEEITEEMCDTYLNGLEEKGIKVNE